jgi:hypothetical protein
MNPKHTQKQKTKLHRHTITKFSKLVEKRVT